MNTDDQPAFTPANPFPAATPWLTPASLFIGGRMKVEPEDFVVEEIPAYPLSGIGEHLYLWIQKRDVSAEALVGHLARSLEISRDDIGVAGLKDRRAVTRQWVSVPAEVLPRVPQIDTDAIQVLNTCLHGNKLKTGHLLGNRFEILVRDTLPDAFRIASELQSIVREQGVPNFFGEQRFGLDHQTLTLGLSLLKGESSPREIPFKRRKFLTRLALSAAQSSLFNEVLNRRIDRKMLHQVHVGDVMQVTASGGLFVVEDPAIEQPRFDRRETNLTGPLFGPKMKSPLHEIFQLEQEVLTAAGLSRDEFRAYKKLTPGGRRPLLLFPENLQVQQHPSDVLLSFSLPSGAYATIVLEEFMKQAGMAADAAHGPNHHQAGLGETSSANKDHHSQV